MCRSTCKLGKHRSTHLTYNIFLAISLIVPRAGRCVISNTSFVYYQEVDAAVAGLTITSRRSEAVAFTEPFWTYPVVIGVKVYCFRYGHLSNIFHVKVASLLWIACILGIQNWSRQGCSLYLIPVHCLTYWENYCHIRLKGTSRGLSGVFLPLVMNPLGRLKY